jgi:hypothetical protein
MNKAAARATETRLNYQCSLRIGQNNKSRLQAETRKDNMNCPMRGSRRKASSQAPGLRPALPRRPRRGGQHHIFRKKMKQMEPFHDNSNHHSRHRSY